MLATSSTLAVGFSCAFLIKKRAAAWLNCACCAGLLFCSRRFNVPLFCVQSPMNARWLLPFESLFIVVLIPFRLEVLGFGFLRIGVVVVLVGIPVGFSISLSATIPYRVIFIRERPLHLHWCLSWL